MVEVQTTDDLNNHKRLNEKTHEGALFNSLPMTDFQTCTAFDQPVSLPQLQLFENGSSINKERTPTGQELHTITNIFKNGSALEPLPQFVPPIDLSRLSPIDCKTPPIEALDKRSDGSNESESQYSALTPNQRKLIALAECRGSEDNRFHGKCWPATADVLDNLTTDGKLASGIPAYESLCNYMNGDSRFEKQNTNYPDGKYWKHIPPGTVLGFEWTEETIKEHGGQENGHSCIYLGEGTIVDALAFQKAHPDYHPKFESKINVVFPQKRSPVDDSQVHRKYMFIPAEDMKKFSELRDVPAKPIQATDCLATLPTPGDPRWTGYYKFPPVAYALKSNY